MGIRNVLEVDAHRPPLTGGRGRRLLSRSDRRFYEDGGEKQDDDGRAMHVLTLQDALCRRAADYTNLALQDGPGHLDIVASHWG